MDRRKAQSTENTNIDPTLFEEAVGQTAHAVYITDTDGVIEYVNPAFERITGYDAEEVLGEPTSLLQSGEYDDEWYDDLWETILEGEQFQREMVDQTKDGERIVLEQTISPVMGDDGEVTKFIAVAYDITERKAYETLLEEQRDNLELLNHVLRHDIRNHLQVVAAYAEHLEDYIDQSGAEYLDKVRTSTDNAIALTGAAKDMAEVMIQSTAPNEPVTLAPVLNQQIDEFRNSYPDVLLQVEGEIPRVDVVGNSMLSSVFRNLLKNAIQHNDKSVPELVVSVHDEEQAVRVAFADNGPGVPDDQKDAIFGKGQKGLDSIGSGIGLYLVHSLVTDYGGEVWVEDNDPEGSVFVVRLEKPA